MRHMNGIRIIPQSYSPLGLWFTLRYTSRNGQQQETPEGFVPVQELRAMVTEIEREANREAQMQLPWN